MTGADGEAEDPLAKLPQDKRQKILDASIREFAENGYEKASTNAIVKEAGIAKGLLFHYFGNKKELYLYVLDYCIEHYVDYFLRNLGDLPADLLDRLMAWGTLKVKMLSEDPLIYRMSVSTIEGVTAEIKSELMQRYAKQTERLMPVFLKGMDFSGLREGLDPQEAIQFVLLVLNSVSEKFLASSRARPDRGLTDLPAALEEMQGYADILRHGLYRPDR